MSENKPYCGVKEQAPPGRRMGTAEYCAQTNQVRRFGRVAIAPRFLTEKEKSGKRYNLIDEQLKLRRLQDTIGILTKEIRMVNVVIKDDRSTPSQLKTANGKKQSIIRRKENLMKRIAAQKKVVEHVKQIEADKKKEKAKGGAITHEAMLDKLDEIVKKKSTKTHKKKQTGGKKPKASGSKTANPKKKTAKKASGSKTAKKASGSKTAKKASGSKTVKKASGSKKKASGSKTAKKSTKKHVSKAQHGGKPAKKTTKKHISGSKTQHVGKSAKKRTSKKTKKPMQSMWETPKKTTKKTKKTTTKKTTKPKKKVSGSKTSKPKK